MDIDKPSLPSSILADRQFVVSYLSSLAPPGSRDDSWGNTSSEQATDILAVAMRTVVSDPDVDWRDLVVHACFNKRLKNWMETRSWLLDTTNGDIAACVRGVSFDRIVDNEVETFLMDKRQEKDGSWEEILGQTGILRQHKE